MTASDVSALEEDPDCVEYVHASSGLYPLPLARNVKSSHRNKIRAKFIFLGKFIAKAVLDNRMIDLPFSAPFYSWLLRSEQVKYFAKWALKAIRKGFKVLFYLILYN